MIVDSPVVLQPAALTRSQLQHQQIQLQSQIQPQPQIRIHSPTTAPVQPYTAAGTARLSPSRSMVTSFAPASLARGLELGPPGARPSTATQQTPSAPTLLLPPSITASTTHTAPFRVPPYASMSIAFGATHKPGGPGGRAPSNDLRNQRVRRSDVAAAAAAAAAAATAALAAMGDDSGEDGEVVAIRGRLAAMDSSVRNYAAAVSDEVGGVG